MEMSVNQQDDKVTISITGSIDERGAEEMKRLFLDMEISTLKEVLLDFSGVTFIGSAGIGKLLLLYKNLVVHGGTITIEKMSKDIYTMFKVVKLDKIFNLQAAE